MALKESLVTDQGNGATYCSNCGQKVALDDTFCMYCFEHFTGFDKDYTNFGGSDF